MDANVIAFHMVDKGLMLAAIWAAWNLGKIIHGYTKLYSSVISKYVEQLIKNKSNGADS